MCSYIQTFITWHVEVPRLTKSTPISSNTSPEMSFYQVTCGENLCIGTDLPSFILLNCRLQSVTTGEDHRLKVYRDNTSYTSTSHVTLNESTIPTSLGTYKFVLSDSCGMDVALSVISLCGKLCTIIYVIANQGYDDDPHFRCNN